MIQKEMCVHVQVIVRDVRSSRLILLSALVRKFHTARTVHTGQGRSVLHHHASLRRDAGAIVRVDRVSLRAPADDARAGDAGDIDDARERRAVDTLGGACVKRRDATAA